MATTPTEQPIVVGLDDSETAWRALDWAAGEAARQRCPLHVVHAYDLQIRKAPMLPMTARLAGFDAGRWLLEAAEHHLNEFHPGLDISSVLAAGAASHVLVHSVANGARMLVLGRSHVGRLARAVGGSTVLSSQGPAGIPVVVIPPTWPSCAEPPRPERKAVLVGVDETPHSLPALDFAVRTAASRPARLIVVHAWELENPYIANVSMIEQQIHDGRERAELLLDKLVGDAVTGHPGLDVETACPRARPEAALLDQASRGDLLVIGGRRHRRFGTILTGRTTRSLLDRAPSPLAIVHG